MELLNKILCQISEKEAIDLTRSLIKIPSTVGNEKMIGDYLSIELTKLGIPLERIEAKEGRPNIISRIKGQTDDFGLILVGHTDTVPVEKRSGESWDVDPFGGDFENNSIYGLGSSDMKGGIASILLAVKAILNAKVKLKKGASIVFCVDEEAGSIEGMKYISERNLVRGNLAISAEPTNMCVQGWFKGIAWYEIVSKGKSAHPSFPARGINAIHHMVDIIYKIKNTGFQHEKHELLSDCTINFGTIEGGTSVKSIPDMCKSILEVRMVPGQTVEGVFEQINTYISELKKIDSSLEASVRITYGKDPMEISPRDPIIDLIQEISQKAMGRKLQLGRSGAAAGDLYYLWKNMGLPGIYFGPGDMGCAHSPNEHVEVVNIVNAAKCYAALILEFCEGYFERS